MKPGFATILSALRRESAFSQKKVADDLGVSQALLSHYENGVREPKLEFIIKASEYYQVTTDYILGRTTERGPGSAALRSRNDFQKCCADAAALIAALLTDLQHSALSETAVNYLNFSLYSIFSALRAKKRRYEPLFDAACKSAEAAFYDEAREALADAGLQKKLSDEALRELYPEQYNALLRVEDHVKKSIQQLKQLGK